MELNDSLFRFSLLLLFVPLCVGCGLGLLMTFIGLRRRQVMEGWPAVTARVLETEVQQSRYSGMLGSHEMAWDLVVNYEYEVGGSSYMGQVSLEVAVPRSRRTVEQAVVDEAVDRAKANLIKGLVVHVNPANPSLSMLPVERSAWAYARLVVFGVGVAVSGWVLTQVFYV